MKTNQHTIPAIVYVDGRLADHIGKLGLQEVADTLAKLAREPVDVLVFGISKHHATARIIGSLCLADCCDNEACRNSGECIKQV